MNHPYNEDGHKCRGYAKCKLICPCTVEDGYCENAGWRCESCRNSDPSWGRYIERTLEYGDDSEYENW